MEFLLEDGTYMGVRGVNGERNSCPENGVSEYRDDG